MYKKKETKDSVWRRKRLYKYTRVKSNATLFVQIDIVSNPILFFIYLLFCKVITLFDVRVSSYGYSRVKHCWNYPYKLLTYKCVKKTLFEYSKQNLRIMLWALQGFHEFWILKNRVYWKNVNCIFETPGIFVALAVKEKQFLTFKSHSFNTKG